MFKMACSSCGEWYWVGDGCPCWSKPKKKVKLFVRVDDKDVALSFTWEPTDGAWVCKMDDDFMQELGPLPIDEEKNT